MNNNELLIEYFDVKLTWDKDNPKIKFIFKENKKNGKKTLFKCGHIPYTPANIEFYYHFIDDKIIAKKLYDLRKKMYNKINAINWYIDVFNVNKDNRKKLIDYTNEYNNKIKKGVREYYNSDRCIEGKIKREATNKKKYGDNYRSKRAKERYENKKWKEWFVSRTQSSDAKKKRKISLEKYYSIEENRKKASIRAKKFYSIKENLQKHIESCNTPEFLEKISVSAKKMWERARENPEKYRSMITSGYGKHYIASGSKMNSIEYIVSTIIDDCGYNWIYEPIITDNNKTYIPDFYIPDKNYIIECYGDFWHANPVIYNENDIVFNNKNAIEYWNQDKKRKEFFEELNYKFVYFWENDINNDKEGVLKRIKNELS